MDPDELEYEERFEHQNTTEHDYRPMGFWSHARSRRMHKGKVRAGGYLQGYREPNEKLESDDESV